MMVHANTGNTQGVIRQLQGSGEGLKAFVTAAWGDALCAAAWQNQVSYLKGTRL